MKRVKTLDPRKLSNGAAGKPDHGAAGKPAHGVADKKDHGSAGARAPNRISKLSGIPVARPFISR